MADDYSQSVVRLAIGQMCKNAGFDAINESALEVLVDLAEKQMTQIGRKTRRYAEQFGRTDPTVDDLEMTFRETGISVKELTEQKKYFEVVTLPQPVHEYPADPQAPVKLFIPELDDEGKIVKPAPVATSHAMSRSNSVVDNTGNAKQPVDTSPLKISKKSVSSKVGDGRENRQFRIRTQLMMEDGEISSTFRQGKPPLQGRPPRPLHEVNIPKLKAEPIIKPKIKTGNLKPKPKVPQPPPVIEKIPDEPIEPPVVAPVSKPKSSKHSEKKKKKKVIPAETGFSDIFGAPLEQPRPKSSKSSRGETPSMLPEEINAGRSSSSASYRPDDAMLSDREPSPVAERLQELNKEKMKKVDDVIDSVVAFAGKNRDGQSKSSSKFSDKSPSKKLKGAGHSRSPHKKNKSSDHGVSAAKADRQRPEKNREPSPAPLTSGISGDRMKSKKKKSRRTQLLEKFAARPMVQADHEEPPLIDSPSANNSNSGFSPLQSVHPEPVIVSDDVSPAPPVNNLEDEEDAIVNVDDDSDIDCGPLVPAAQSPFHSYVETVDPPTPTFEPPAMEAPQPMEHETTMSGMADHNRWEVSGEMQQPAYHTSWEDGNSQTIDFGPAHHNTGEVVTKKEKHKKEKKEKKEKKKKKHKEKDKDRESSKHKHKKDKSHHSPSPYIEQDMSREGGHSHKLTIKYPPPMETEYSEPMSDLNASYNSQDDVQYTAEASSQHVPKLVIKPMAVVEPTTYVPPQAPPVGSFPDMTAYPPPSQSYQASARYEEPTAVPDEHGKIWICPGCNRPDDGSPMIGCDGCDEWFHWSCVGISHQPPEDVEWFCPTCASRKKKKKRKKDKR